MYKYSLGHGKFEYFPNMLLLERLDQNLVFENDLRIYINHLKNIEEGGKSRFL